ncbi:MAG: DNA/RNA helicase domain-containing protein [Thermoplasmataceae archaeon]
MGNYAWFSSTSDFLKELESSAFLLNLKERFKASFRQEPSIEQMNSWKAEIGYLRQVLSGVKGSIILEYRIPGSGERADVVIISEGADRNAIVLEMKGWRKAFRKNAFIYETDQNPKEKIDPVYQLLNYVGKIRFTSSSGDRFRVDGKVVMYNVDRNTKEEIVIFRSEERKLESFLKLLISTVDADDNGRTFVNSYYRQNKALFTAIREHYHDLKKGAMDALAAGGFGLYADQLSVFSRLGEAVEKKESGQFLIEGGPGSGKTLIALELLLKAQSAEMSGAICYRNNRMVESLRKLFASIERGLDADIKYFSTGRPGNPGVAEQGWNGDLQLAIFDEAQRMTFENISLAGRSAKTTMFFFDEKQILSKAEKGTMENFLKVYPDATRLKLSGLYRNGLEYGEFVENLLNSKPEPIATGDYEIGYFEELGEMLRELRKRQIRGKTALVASFTESRGDGKNRNSMDNVRVGYPLSSGFNLYKDSGLTLKWLMDPKRDYAPFWVDGQCNALETCASVYGSQGFEADYVGVIWGRDLVWRGNRFELGDNCEDSMGGKSSLKSMFFKGKLGKREDYDLARALLINRYRILLTRGIRGTFVFCEDRETSEFMKQTMSVASNALSGQYME